MKREEQLYGRVEDWLRRSYRCFHTVQNKGLTHSRVDVCGMRDIGGDLECDVELVGVEVKRGNQPFATCAGQAAGYRVYAHRVYLAEFRPEPFTRTEQEIAAYLGVGLLHLTSSRRVLEALTAPRQEPVRKLSLQLFEKLGYASCRVCGTAFRMNPKGTNPWVGIGRQNLKKSLESGGAYMYWVKEVSDRKRRRGLENRKGISERRYICPYCVEYVLGATVELAVAGGV